MSVSDVQCKLKNTSRNDTVVDLGHRDREKRLYISVPVATSVLLSSC